MNRIIRHLNNKSIAIVGNANSIMSKHRDIDNYDIVIRMNKGYPKDKEYFIGKRTDILALSLNLTQWEVDEFKPKYILWCTPHTELMGKYLEKTAYIYPFDDWKNLNRILGERPSTGCMVFDFIIKNVIFKELHIYGMDFGTSGTWYSNHVGPHDFDREEKHIFNIIEKEDNIFYHN